MSPAVRWILAACLLAAPGACADGGAAPDVERAAPDAEQAAPADAADEPAFRAARRAALDLDERGALPGQRVEAWRAAAELRPRAGFVLEKLGRALLDANLQGEGAEVLARAVDARPDDGDTRRLLARVLLDLGRDDDARALLLDAVQRDLADADTLAQLAQVHDRAGERELARARLDEAVTRWPDDAGRARALRGRLHLEAGALDAARADFEAAAQQRPDDATAIKGLADVARREGDDTRADHWDEVLGLLVDLTDNVVLRDDAGFRKPRLRRLAELHPEWVEGWHELARRMQAAGRADEACAFVREQFERLPSLRAELRAELRTRFCGGADG